MWHVSFKVLMSFWGYICSRCWYIHNNITIAMMFMRTRISLTSEVICMVELFLATKLVSLKATQNVQHIAIWPNALWSATRHQISGIKRTAGWMERPNAQFRLHLVVVRPRHLSDWYYRHSAEEVFTCCVMLLTPGVCKWDVKECGDGWERAAEGETKGMRATAAGGIGCIFTCLCARSGTVRLIFT